MRSLRIKSIHLEHHKVFFLTQFNVSFANSPLLVKALEKSLDRFMVQFGVALKKYIHMNSVLSGPQKFISMQRTSSKAFEMPFSVAKSSYVRIATHFNFNAEFDFFHTLKV